MFVRWRSIVYVGGWPLGYVFTGLIAMATREWTAFLIAISVVAIAPLILTFLWVVESPKWLIERGRTADAKRVLLRIAKRNGIQDSEAKIAGLFAVGVIDGQKPAGDDGSCDTSSSLAKPSPRR